MKTLTALFLFLLVASSANAAKGLSAARFAEESVSSARERATKGHFEFLQLNVRPEDVAVPYSLELDLSSITDWQNLSQVEMGFKYIRDLRFLTTAQDSKFLRRASWLYPDDGCFVRASVANVILEKTHAYRDINKVFAFGPLQVKTTNSPSGFVSWWYHVAPIVRVGPKAYVLDPAVEPEEPIELDKWISTISSDKTNVKVSFCDANAYDPYSDCFNGDAPVESTLFYEQGWYLDYEKMRLIDLGRDADRELGDFPPWLH